MKKVIFASCLIVTCFASSVLAQRGSLGIHVGYINPKDTKSGFMIGGMWGTSVDESVDIGIGFDVIHKSYTKRDEVFLDQGTGYTNPHYEVEKLTYSRTILPFMAEINVKIPTSRYFGYLLRGDLGYSWLWSNEENFVTKKNDKRTYSGFGWQIGAGIYYNIGSRSTFTADLFYLGNVVSRDAKKRVEGLPVYEKVDLSGFGIRLGVLLDLR